uniref:Uncharacterized protein n=1 Tax=Anguilla anguilla TaxID=7936 RepID=A0A0E9X2G9_ANGAN
MLCKQGDWQEQYSYFIQSRMSYSLHLLYSGISTLTPLSLAFNHIRPLCQQFLSDVDLT